MVVKLPDDADGGIDPPQSRGRWPTRRCRAILSRRGGPGLARPGVPPGRAVTAPSGGRPAPAWCAC